MCLCFFGGDCFQQPELFLSTITINKARARWFFFFIFHSKYFLHPVSSQFTRWTGVCSSKEAHEAISSSSSSSVLMQSPAPAPAPGTPTVPSQSLQSKGQVLLGRNERNALHTCVRAHSHTHTYTRKHFQSQRKEKNKTRSLEDTAAHVIPGSAGLPPHSAAMGGRAEGRRLQSIKLPLRTCQTDNSWKELTFQVHQLLSSLSPFPKNQLEATGPAASLFPTPWRPTVSGPS